MACRCPGAPWDCLRPANGTAGRGSHHRGWLRCRPPQRGRCRGSWAAQTWLDGGSSAGTHFYNWATSHNCPHLQERQANKPTYSFSNTFVSNWILVILFFIEGKLNFQIRLKNTDLSRMAQCRSPSQTEKAPPQCWCRLKEESSTWARTNKEEENDHIDSLAFICVFKSWNANGISPGQGSRSHLEASVSVQE